MMSFPQRHCGTGGHVTPNVTAAESICSSFTNKRENNNGVRIASEKSVNLILCLILFNTNVLILYQPKWNPFLAAVINRQIFCWS